MVDFALPYLNGAFVDIVAREDNPSQTTVVAKSHSFLAKLGLL